MKSTYQNQIPGLKSTRIIQKLKETQMRKEANKAKRWRNQSTPQPT